MNAIYFLFQYLLSLLLCYASFVSVYISFFKNKQFDILTLFFVSTLIILAGFSVYNIYQISNKKNHSKSPLYLIFLSAISVFIPALKNIQKNRVLTPEATNKIETTVTIKNLYFFKQNKYLLILCFVSLLIGFFNVYTQYLRGIDNGEMVQFDMSLLTNTIESSYKQQQPPLDYYFSSFSQSLFGESKFALRFHAMFFYLILSLIMPLGLYFFCSSFWITLLGTSLFSFNHIIRFHSLYARPICLVLLTGFIFLFFYLSYCQNKADRKFIFPVLASQYLFAMSIGLQPVIFIISLFISSFWLLFDNKKEIFKKLFLTNIMTAVLTLPFYIKMFFFGKSAHKFKEISLDAVGSYIKNMDIVYFFQKYFSSFYEQMSPSFFIFVTGFMITVLVRKPIGILTLMMLSSLLLFPLLYDSVFYIGLVWFRLNNWYIVVFSLFIILFVVFSLKEIYEYFKGKRWKAYLLFPLTIIFLCNAYSQIKAIKNETQFQFPYRDNSIEQVYDYLKKQGDSKDIAVEFSLSPVVAFRFFDISMRMKLFYNSELHPFINIYQLKYTKKPPFFHERTGDIIYYIKDWQNLPEKESQKIFFIVETENEEDIAHNVLSKFMKGYKIGIYMIFELTLSHSNKEKEYINFLYKINSITSKKYKGALYETLIYYAYRNNDKKEFNRLLQEYRGIEMALDEFIQEVNYPSRFELRRRVKYFENLNWD